MKGVGCRVWSSGCRAQGAGVSVQGFGCGVDGGFMGTPRLQKSTVAYVNRGSTFALRSSTRDFCLGGQFKKNFGPRMI